MITEKGDEHSLSNQGAQKETSSRLPPVPEVSETDSQISNVGLQPAQIDSNKFVGGIDGVHTPVPYEDSENESQETDMDSDVPGFNWEQLESRFTAAIQQLDTEESQILDQFDHLMEMFFIWAQSGSALETDRSVKRHEAQNTGKVCSTIRDLPQKEKRALCSGGYCF
ncbi:BgtA-20162 [Blumeria graminis f. sp. tritici]|uniref:BgtA-20162 n=2 Tax=Blumeria graminis f. sp. tritici TaxID=62690 RepID=A0A9X9MMC9_BLUGR|nr:hypothetical protein BGT96224_A20162 [Blumeria graminis f. sp. tritici 96224]VDB93244.1 BgtA-20162 [Blumeria graminis f. sp. tritici]